MQVSRGKHKIATLSIVKWFKNIEQYVLLGWNIDHYKSGFVFTSLENSPSRLVCPDRDLPMFSVPVPEQMLDVQQLDVRGSLGEERP